jgi:hypothetical protein
VKRGLLREEYNVNIFKDKILNHILLGSKNVEGKKPPYEGRHGLQRSHYINKMIICRSFNWACM